MGNNNQNNDDRGLASADQQTRQRVAKAGGEARAENADYESMGEKGGRSQGQENNPGNFANSPKDEVRKAAKQGGES